MNKYLIFGGTGSLGKKLIDRLLPTNHVSVYSRDEAKHWTIKNDLSVHPQKANLDFYVGDIRDAYRVKDVIRQVQPTHIIIASALKQVDTCEISPSESIGTNVQGTTNVVNALTDLNPISVKTCLFVSTDKACAPVNVYGICKALSERIITSQAQTGYSWINYLAVRYGNVLESRGSIIPLFKYQAEHNSCLTVTDPDMTRYVMTLDDSVNLILHAIKNGKSGETWIPRLPAMKIGDLAKIFADRHGKEIKIVGSRPGEKKHEDLINESESTRTTLIGDHYVLAPSFSQSVGSPFTYSSNQTVMTKDELYRHLHGLGIIQMKSTEFVGMTIEELDTKDLG